jgi:rhodanese-related sulfurtransferase
VHRKPFLNINLITVLIILILSSVSGLVYNYFNPAGLEIISLSDEPEVQPGEIKFYQPVRVDTEDANLLFENSVQFIDVRSPSEFTQGHIPNSINIPHNYIDDLEHILSDFSKDTPFVLYGNSNSDIPDIVAREMLHNDYNKIYIYPDGYDEWIRNNHPVVK